MAMRRQWILICTLWVLWVPVLPAAVTPTDVFIEAKALKNGLATLVNQRAGMSLLPLIDIDVTGTKPHHVYAMAIALNEKLGVYMATKQINGFTRSGPPKAKITPGDVHALVLIAQRNLATMASNLTLERHQAKDKKPADVLVEIIYANLWIDQLMDGKITPDYPFQITQMIQHELERLRQHANINPILVNPPTYAKATPGNVFNNAENFYRLLVLSDTMRNQVSNPNHTYDIRSSGTQVKPIHVFTLSVFNLYYLTVIEHRLGLTPNLTYPELKQSLTPADVFRQYDIINAMLLNILANLTVAS